MIIKQIAALASACYITHVELRPSGVEGFDIELHKEPGETKNLHPKELTYLLEELAHELHNPQHMENPLLLNTRTDVLSECLDGYAQAAILLDKLEQTGLDQITLGYDAACGEGHVQLPESKRGKALSSNDQRGLRLLAEKMLDYKIPNWRDMEKCEGTIELDAQNQAIRLVSHQAIEVLKPEIQHKPLSLAAGSLKAVFHELEQTLVKGSPTTYPMPRLQVTFSAYGGEADGVVFSDPRSGQNIPRPSDIHKAVPHTTYITLSELGEAIFDAQAPDWKEGEGSYGVLTFDFASGQAFLDLNRRELEVHSFDTQEYVNQHVLYDPLVDGDWHKENESAALTSSF